MSLKNQLENLVQKGMKPIDIYRKIEKKRIIRDKQLIEYLKSQFSNIEEAKVWIENWANKNNQTIQNGEFKGLLFSINYMIRLIALSLGENIDSAFESKHYWKLRNHYEENIEIK